jgi:phosphoglycerate dehydrogenase-like enzyme
MKFLFHKLGHYEYWAENIKKLKSQYPHCEFNAVDMRENAELLSETDVIITRDFTGEDLQIAKNLKVVFTPKIGVNGFPVEELKKRNIPLCNHEGEPQIIAEKAIALTLTLMGRIIEFHDALKHDGIWRIEQSKTFWTSLQGKTCAVLGLGSIGKNIAKLLSSFDCHVMGYRQDLSKPRPEHIHEVEGNLNELISKADVIFVCLPLNDHTKGLIDESMLSQMHNKFIINVGRAAIIDEKALYEALKHKTLAGFASDVWYQTPEIKDTGKLYPSKLPIYKLDNVVISPHCATHTLESRWKSANALNSRLEKYINEGVLFI